MFHNYQLPRSQKRESGAPVLRGTRIPVGAIIANFDYGVSIDRIAEPFEISAPQIKAIVAYAQSHRIAAKRLSPVLEAYEDVKAGRTQSAEECLESCA